MTLPLEKASALIRNAITVVAINDLTVASIPIKMYLPRE